MAAEGSPASPEEAVLMQKYMASMGMSQEEAAMMMEEGDES